MQGCKSSTCPIVVVPHCLRTVLAHCGERVHGSCRLWCVGAHLAQRVLYPRRRRSR